MLPANLAKTRAAGRGAYGESSGPPGGSMYRYAPYPSPAALLAAGAGVGAHSSYRRALAAALRPPPAFTLADLIAAQPHALYAPLSTPLATPLTTQLAAPLPTHLAAHLPTPLL